MKVVVAITGMPSVIDFSGTVVVVTAPKRLLRRLKAMETEIDCPVPGELPGGWERRKVGHVGDAVEEDET